MLNRRILLIISSILLAYSAFGGATTNSRSLPVTGFTSTPNIYAIDNKITYLMQKWNIPGGALVVMKDSKIIAARGYGWADTDRKEPVQPNSLFRIASISKTITATAILKLVQDHKLNLDDKVFNILNGLTPLNDRKLNPGIYQITIRNLLQMSSGWFLPGSHIDPMFGPWGGAIRTTLSPELPASCETTTRYMMSVPLRRKPGTIFSYSNLDYCILGMIVSKVVGNNYHYLTYQNYIKTNILNPLGIKDMFIGSTQLKYRSPQEVHYYQDPRVTNSGELANSFYFPYSTTEILKKNFGNGGWVASAIDLATIVQALNNGKILNPEILAIMRSKPDYIKISSQAPAKTTKKKGKKTKAPTPAMTNNRYYAMGGIIYNVAGKQYWVQTGSFTGTNALIVTKPDNTTIAVVFNSRPSAHAFLTILRPQLRQLLMSSSF